MKDTGQGGGFLFPSQGLESGEFVNDRYVDKEISYFHHAFNLFCVFGSAYSNFRVDLPVDIATNLKLDVVFALQITLLPRFQQAGLAA